MGVLKNPSFFDFLRKGTTYNHVDGNALVKLMEAVGLVRLHFFINQTDLLAPTNAQLISPIAGKLSKLCVIIQVAVTTGGPITVLVGTTTVAGLSVTVADGATAGTVLTDTVLTGDGTEVVQIGSRIQIAPDAAFATAGAVNGYVEITPTITV